MSAPIVVINPNSSEAVTGAIDRAVAPLRMAGGPSIECVTLAEGPPGIETQAHVEQVVQPIARLVRAREDAAAFVIACFSDPGLQLAREATARPVLGIAECGMLVALTLGERFGIVSILAGSVPRHLRYVRQLGLAARFAGDLPIGLGVAELADEGKTLVRLARSAPSCATTTAPTCWCWAAPAWRSTATRSSRRSACRWSTRPRPPSPWRSAPSASPRRNGPSS